MSTDAANLPSLFLVDDHAMVRQGLMMVFKQARFSICGEAGGLEEALAHPELSFARLVVVDLSLGEGSGLELITKLQERQLPSLVYSMHEDSHVVRKAFAAGASGYVTKREVASCLVEAVQCVLSGKRYVSPRAAIGLLEHDSVDLGEDRVRELSDRQRCIYALLGEGLSAGEIADKLHVSPRTVESYSARIIEKLSVSGMKELRRKAIADRLPPQGGVRNGL